MVAVEGMENDEILLNDDQHYLTLSSCIKVRETKHANNEQPEFCVIPELIEIRSLEFLQDCLSKCASLMNVKKCSAVNTINQQCVLLGRMNQAKFSRLLYFVFTALLVPCCAYNSSYLFLTVYIKLHIFNHLESETSLKIMNSVKYRAIHLNLKKYKNEDTLTSFQTNQNMKNVALMEPQIKILMRKCCFDTSYLLCCAFCSLLQVSHSSEMQIYVPLIDKICLIQQIAIRQDILDTIDLFLFNSSFKGCISYSYSDMNLFNYSIFAYNEKTRSCSLLYNMPEENMIVNCSEQLHDLRFYKVIHCLPAEGYMYSFEEEVEENVNRIIAVKLKATVEICIVERHPFSENFLLKRSGIVFVQSLELCLAHCRVLSVREKCNAVLFSSDEKVCLLLQQNQPLQSTDVMRKSTSQFFTVNYCDYKRRYYNGTGKITNIRIDDRRLQCTVHEIPLLRVHMKHRSLLWNSIDFQNCIQFCALQLPINLCNAVYFEAEEKTCLHLLLNASQALYEYSENNKETVHFLEKCVEATVQPELQQESAISSSQSNEMHTSAPAGEGSSRTYNVREQARDVFHYVAAENVQEQYVKLYEFLEVCK
ncbi:hypothetical protein T11_16641, partial [Trichinella zimbabwensis]